MQDPLSRITRLEYCDCGVLSAVIDPLGRRTQWDYDLQGRVTAKTFADGSRTHFTYENTTSRLKSVRDEQAQTKSFDYDIADNVARISTSVALHPAPSVRFIYDPNYNRLVARQDGIGTTTYSYYRSARPAHCNGRRWAARGTTTPSLTSMTNSAA